MRDRVTKSGMEDANEGALMPGTNYTKQQNDIGAFVRGHCSCALVTVFVVLVIMVSHYIHVEGFLFNRT